MNFYIRLCVCFFPFLFGGWDVGFDWISYWSLLFALLNLSICFLKWCNLFAVAGLRSRSTTLNEWYLPKPERKLRKNYVATLAWAPASAPGFDVLCKFWSDGQGTVRRAVLYANRSCFELFYKAMGKAGAWLWTLIQSLSCCIIYLHVSVSWEHMIFQRF